jgi:hypothetical protein
VATFAENVVSLVAEGFAFRLCLLGELSMPQDSRSVDRPAQIPATAIRSTSGSLRVF